MFWLQRLLTPLLYLRIKHPAKWKYDLWIPLLLAVIPVLVVVLSPVPINVFGDRGLCDRILGLVTVLVGLYIALLGFVATFGRATMDAPMEGSKPPTLSWRGKTRVVTRRQFLTLLFGYLSFESLLLYLVGTASQLLVPLARDALVPEAQFGFRVTFVFVFGLLFANLVVATLIGLSYMSERIHRDDSADGGPGGTDLPS